LLLGSDLTLSDCASSDPSLFGLNDEINCIAQHYGATPVDAYTPFQANCGPPTVCFSDSLHPNDTGYALIFDAFRDTPGTPVPVPVTTTPAKLWAVSESRPAFCAQHPPPPARGDVPLSSEPGRHRLGGDRARGQADDHADRAWPRRP
jgi:hypothetical protein